MIEETMAYLAPESGRTYVDATLGEGGHAEALLERCGPCGRVVGFDRDPEIIHVARRRLERFGDRFIPVHANHADLATEIARLGAPSVDGVLADLGLSSYHLEHADRGFGLSRNGPLDMRYDRGAGETLAQLLLRMGEREMELALREVGQERWARRIARAVSREAGSIESTGRLAEIVSRAVPVPRGRMRIHPATRFFMTMRIIVNGEIESLDRFLAALPSVLAPGGRAVVLSYQSGEDGRVKRAFAGLATAGRGFDLLTRKPVRPGWEEIKLNARARSACLRVIRRREA